MKNLDIINKWIAGIAYSNKRINMSTDGDNLYSYRLKIGITLNSKKIVLMANAKTKSYGRTTAQHCGLAKRTAGRSISILDADAYTQKAYDDTLDVLNKILPTDLSKLVGSFVW